MIHLVNIAPEFRGVEDFSRPPSGLLYIGNQLRKAGFEVRVHHIVARRMAETTKALAADPDAEWVGFSFFTGPPVARAAQMSKALKELRPDLKVCWGGVHPSSIPRECVALPYVDACVVGEGEETSVELAQAWKSGGDLSGIQGLVWKRADGEVVSNPDRPIKKDLDRFAQDWSLVDPQRYVRYNRAGDRICCITTSRGCPYECGYCYVIDFHKRRWRYHSPDHVVDQMKWLKARTNITHVVFDDDEFFPLRERGFEILERLRREDIRCNWLETVLDYVDDTFLQRLVAADVETIFVGWESGSDRTHATLKTGLTRDMILEKFRLIAKHPSLSVDASAIVCFPDETDEDVQATIDTALEIYRIHPNVQFNIGVYVPYPGTPMYQRAKEKGYVTPARPEDWESHDILAGTMHLPWLKPGVVEQVTMIDGYMKMLFQGRNQRPLQGFLRKLGGKMAEARLRARFFALPMDLAAHSWFHRQSVLRNLEANKISLAGIASPAEA